jgi:hypothetical protein
VGFFAGLTWAFLERGLLGTLASAAMAAIIALVFGLVLLAGLVWQRSSLADCWGEFCRACHAAARYVFLVTPVGGNPAQCCGCWRYQWG